MTRKIVAFAASNSRNSINKQLLASVLDSMDDVAVEILDLNDFELPIFSVEREVEIGQPELAQQFYHLIGAADGLVISLAEHNGNYSAAYKNLFDWLSRIDQKVFQDKPTVLLATSPGGRGGQTVLQIALDSMPRFGADIKANVSVPNFYDNFDPSENKLKNPELAQQITDALNALFN